VPAAACARANAAPRPPLVWAVREEGVEPEGADGVHDRPHPHKEVAREGVGAGGARDHLLLRKEVVGGELEGVGGVQCGVVAHLHHLEVMEKEEHKDLGFSAVRRIVFRLGANVAVAAVPVPSLGDVPMVLDTMGVVAEVADTMDLRRSHMQYQYQYPLCHDPMSLLFLLLHNPR